MKKSVLLMAGLMAMALAGSAQAATMFAVQGGAPVADKFTVDETGVVNAAGQPTIFGSKIAGGLATAPAPTGITLTVPQGNFHFASVGANFADAAFLVQHSTLEAPGFPDVYSSGTAPNFAFYRINKNAAGATILPRVNNDLGYLNFGTIDASRDPNTDAAYRRNIALFRVRAETTWTALNNTPAYFVWSTSLNTTPVTGQGASEKMRLSSDGRLGIGMANITPAPASLIPTSKLQVVGLIEYADNATAISNGLNEGAFYRTGDVVKVVHIP